MWNALWRSWCCKGPGVALVLGFSAATALGAAADPPDAPRPNIVLILADDLGWADVGWHGAEIKTPHLDKLAHAGARLEQFYVQPLCSPTRAALMTGRYPMRHGLQVGVVRPWAQYGLPLEERTLPQALKQAGYETAICGKWHLGHFRREYLPTQRGFEHQYGHYNGAIDYFTHIRDMGFDWHRDDRECRDEGYSTTLIGREAARRITERDRGRPLFLYVPFNAVHAPHEVPERFKGHYAKLPEPRRTYAGMVSAMDEAVGMIVDALEASGMSGETLVIFSSDNGGPSPGRVTSNGPLRGAKSTLYEGGVRVPAFATWPGHIKAGSVVNAPLHVVDWYPTLLTLAGAKLEQPAPLDGHDAWPAIALGKPSPHEAILLNAAPNAGAIRVGDWKLILRRSNGKARDDAGGGDDAVKASGALDAVELFHISDDPNEAHEIAAENTPKVAELRARYEALARQAVPPKLAPKAAGFQTPRVWGE